MSDTTIPVSDELADRLYTLKGRGQTYESLLWEMIEQYDGDAESPQESVGRRQSDSSERREDSPETTDSLAVEEWPETKRPEECRAAVYAVRDYLRDDGPASMREIVTEVMPEQSVGYEVPDLEPGDRYRGAWWRRVVKPGLEQLDEIESPSPGGSRWEYVG